MKRRTIQADSLINFRSRTQGFAHRCFAGQDGDESPVRGGAQRPLKKILRLNSRKPRHIPLDFLYRSPMAMPLPHLDMHTRDNAGLRVRVRPDVLRFPCGQLGGI